MDFKDLPIIVPDLLLFVIPGDIAIKIKETYRFEKKSDSSDVFLCSILYSFVIGIAYSVTTKYFLCFNAVECETIKYIGSLGLAIFLGSILVKGPETRIGIKIRCIFNKNTSPESSVWIKAMKNANGTWATIY